MARRAAKRRAKRLRRAHDQARRGASLFVAFDLLRLNRANLRTNPHGRMKPTGGFRGARHVGVFNGSSTVRQAQQNVAVRP
jgi:hypothetical protein